MNGRRFAALSGAIWIHAVAASAQGLPPGTLPPQYGSQTWSARQHVAHDQTIVPSAPQPPTAPKTAPKTAFDKSSHPATRNGG